MVALVVCIEALLVEIDQAESVEPDNDSTADVVPPIDLWQCARGVALPL